VSLTPDQPLAAPSNPVQNGLLRLAALLGAAAVIAALLSQVDFAHDLHRMRLRLLTGPEQGNYHAIGEALASRAAAKRGVVEVVPSSGSAENVRRLAASRDCTVSLALAQNGSAFGPGVTLLGRLPHSESALFLGRSADGLHAFSELRGKRLALGPEGSGGDKVGREIFSLPDLATLGVSLSNQPIDEALAMAARGDVDLAVLVTSSEAPLVRDWVGRGSLQIASFDHVDALARRLPRFQVGPIHAGVYDAVRDVPPTERRVLKVETVLLGNGCARRADLVDFLGLVSAEMPDFVRHNRDTENTTGLAVDPAAVEFFENGGPKLADQYVPWLVNVMPVENWAYVAMGLSLLFNAMGAGHRFNLWRIDATRVQIEHKLAALYPPNTTLRQIASLPPTDRVASASGRAELGGIVRELENLALRTRRQSLSALVPMGAEMAYRYQEGVVHETLTVLRDLQARCDSEAVQSGAPGAGAAA
jgi:TRAP-type uncharacterized transport system substrate-binding protein